MQISTPTNDTTPATYRVIRVVKTGIDYGKNTKEESTIWEGSDLQELAMSFPASPVFGADPLGGTEIEGGYIRISYRFERSMPDGCWEQCSDPRVRRANRPLTALERAIEADNRRDFPGDYI